MADARSAPRAPGTPRRILWSWALYDFANSPFTTTVTTVVFNVYFAQVVAKNAPVYGDTLWAFLVAASTLASGLLAPFLGALADLRSWKKPLLAFFSFLGAISTAFLAVSRPDTIIASSIFFFIASLSFSCSLSFYNAFLNDLATNKTIGFISGLGWALGYAGGGLCLALNLLMIQKPGLLGLPEHDYWPIRLSFVIVGLWWLVFTVPFLLFVPEKKQPAAAGARGTLGASGAEPAAPGAHAGLWREAFDRVAGTLKQARTAHRNLFRYLIAYLLYNDGIETVIVMSGVFASQVMGMGQGEIIACFLMIQFVAFFGALGFGRLGDHFSNKKALQWALALWAVVLFWALFMQAKIEFWMAGALIAIVLGGSQSLSRSLFGKLIPAGSEAQFYGFLGLSSKISATLGPLAYGLSRQITGSPRIAIFSMLVFFVLGQILLLKVYEPAGDSV